MGAHLTFGKEIENSSMALDLTYLLDQAEDGYLIPCRKEDGTTDIHARATSGDTLLHVAVGQRDFSAIRHLAEAGLDINARGDFYQTPFYSAARTGDFGIIGLLLQLGADPSIPDHLGDLPCDMLFSRLKQCPEDFLMGLSSWIDSNSAKTNKKQAEQGGDGDAGESV